MHCFVELSEYPPYQTCVIKCLNMSEKSVSVISFELKYIRLSFNDCWTERGLFINPAAIHPFFYSINATGSFFGAFLNFTDIFFSVKTK